MDSIQQGEFENASSMLADDFQFSGSVAEPINKEAWVVEPTNGAGLKAILDQLIDTPAIL